MWTVLWICEDCFISIMICSDTYVGNTSLALYASCSSSSKDMQELAELISLGLALLSLYSFLTWACCIWLGWTLCGAMLSFFPAVAWLVCSYMDNSKSRDAVYKHIEENEIREDSQPTWICQGGGCYIKPISLLPWQANWIHKGGRDRSDTTWSV